MMDGTHGAVALRDPCIIADCDTATTDLPTDATTCRSASPAGDAERQF